MLKLPEEKRTELLNSIRTLYHVTDTEFTFKHLLELALNRETTLLIKEKEAHTKFNLSLEQNKNYIIIEYDGVTIDSGANLNAISSNIEVNSAALAEHNNLVNKAKENIATLQENGSSGFTMGTPI